MEKELFFLIAESTLKKRQMYERYEQMKKTIKKPEKAALLEEILQNEKSHWEKLSFLCDRLGTNLQDQQLSESPQEQEPRLRRMRSRLRWLKSELGKKL